MHTLTATIRQQTGAIKQQLNASNARLSEHLERSAQRHLIHTALIFTATIIAMVAALYITP